MPKPRFTFRLNNVTGSRIGEITFDTSVLGPSPINPDTVLKHLNKLLQSTILGEQLSVLNGEIKNALAKDKPGSVIDVTVMPSPLGITSTSGGTNNELPSPAREPKQTEKIFVVKAFQSVFGETFNNFKKETTHAIVQSAKDEVTSMRGEIERLNKDLNESITVRSRLERENKDLLDDILHCKRQQQAKELSRRDLNKPDEVTSEGNYQDPEFDRPGL